MSYTFLHSAVSSAQNRSSILQAGVFTQAYLDFSGKHSAT